MARCKKNGRHCVPPKLHNVLSSSSGLTRGPRVINTIVPATLDPRIKSEGDIVFVYPALMALSWRLATVSMARDKASEPLISAKTWS